MERWPNRKFMELLNMSDEPSTAALDAEQGSVAYGPMPNHEPKLNNKQRRVLRAQARRAARKKKA